MKWAEFARSLFPGSGPEIRPMTSADLEEVLRIIRLHDSDDYRAAKRAFQDTRFDLAEDVSLHLVLLDPASNEPVGVSGYFVEDSEARGIFWLGWTYVNPFHRGKGYGAMLLHTVIRGVKRFGARKLYLSTSSLPEYEAARAFYAKFGFVQEGRLVDYFTQGEDKIIMGLEI